MLALTLLVVALPTLVAQTRLLLGIPLQFHRDGQVCGVSWAVGVGGRSA